MLTRAAPTASILTWMLAWMASIPHVTRHASRITPDLLEFTDFEVIPIDHELRTARREEKKSVVDRQSEAAPTPATTDLARPSTQNKLKDLFAPREQEGELLAMHGIVFPHKILHRLTLIGHLDLDLEMDLNPDEPTSPSAATSAPVAMSGLTTQQKALDLSLPLFFPQKGHVQMVRFVGTEDNAGIRAHWEAVCKGADVRVKMTASGSS
jgi:hypothetical protein